MTAPASPTPPGTATVAELRRFPVKSMLGELLPRLAFDGRGAVGDRVWAVTYADGKLGSGKSNDRFRRTDGLLYFTAAYADEDRDGADEGADDGDMGADTAGRPRIRTPRGEKLRDDAHLAELVGEPVRLAREDARADGARHFDRGAVSLATTGSLHALAGILGDPEPVSVRRFRKNILLDVDEPWTEEGWIGRELAVGDRLRLRVTRRIKRCVMTTMPQHGLDEDRRMLKTLTAERGMCFGIYADVVAPGTVYVGDPVQPL